MAAFIPYISSMRKGRTRPNRATWWIWTLVGLLLAASYYSVGARHTLWVPLSYVAGPLIIAVFSLRLGVGGWGRLDRFCLFGAALSLVLWGISHSPLVALVLNIVIDLMGAIPTIRKAFLEPQTEDRAAWVLFLVGNTFNLFAINRRQFAIIVYPAYLFFISFLMILLISREGRSTVGQRNAP